jgi:hypothetical protein
MKQKSLGQYTNYLHYLRRDVPLGGFFNFIYYNR